MAREHKTIGICTKTKHDPSVSEQDKSARSQLLGGAILGVASLPD